MQLKIQYFNRACDLLSARIYQKDQISTVVQGSIPEEARGDLDFEGTAYAVWQSVIGIAEKEGTVKSVLKIAQTLREFDGEMAALENDLEQHIIRDEIPVDIRSHHRGEGTPFRVLFVADIANRSVVRQLRNHLAVYSDCIELLDIRDAQDNIACNWILLILTPDLVGADWPWYRLVQYCMTCDIRVIPVLAKTCDWKRIEYIGKMVPLPNNGIFLSNTTFWNDTDRAYNTAGEELRNIAAALEPLFIN